MATDKSRSRYQGFLIQDPRITSASIWAAQSTFTEAGPEPGDPEPQADYNLVLAATGDQTASKELRVQTQRSGHPVANGGSFVWQENGDTNWRGWDPPNVGTAWEAIVFSTTSNRTQNPHTIALRSGVVLVAAAEFVATNYVVRVHARATDGTITTVQVHGGGTSAPVHGFHPCLVELPNDRVMIYFWVEDADSSLNQIRAYYSDDDAASWTLAQTDCLLTGVDTAGSAGVSGTGGDPGRIRAAYGNSQVMLVHEFRDHDNNETEQDLFKQYASDDLGLTFRLIATWDKTVSGEGGRFPEIVYADDRFVFAYIARSTASLALRVVGSAFQDLLTVPVVAPSIGITEATSGTRTVATGDLAVCLDADNTLWFLMRHNITAAQQNMCIFRSLDTGTTLEAVGDHTGITNGTDNAWWTPNVDSLHPSSISACASRGRVIVAHNITTPSQFDPSLCLTYLGGSSSVTMPHISPGPGIIRSLGFIGANGQTWLPYALPSSAGWTGAGAGTETLQSPGEANISTTTGQARTWTLNPTGTFDGGVIGHFQVRINDGGSLTGQNVSAQFRMADGTDDIDISFRFTTTQFSVYDENGGPAQVGSTQTHTGVVEILFALQAETTAAANLAVWWRNATTLEDRDWTAGPTSAAVTNAGASATTNAIIFGHIAASVSDSDWLAMDFFTEDSAIADIGAATTLAAGFTNPDDLLGREYSANPIHVDDGVLISATDGPGVKGESYNIDSRARFEIERIFADRNRSPRERWRTTAETQATIALQLDSALLGTKESELGSDLIGIALFGCNFRTAQLERWDVGTGAWVKVMELDAATGMDTMEYSRIGHTIRPGTPTDKPQLRTNEARGWTMDLGSSKYRRAKWNREGIFDGAYAGPNLHIHLDGIDDTEPASGTASLWSTTIVGVANMLGETAAGWRLLIDAQTTVDGYFEIGQIVIGPIIVCGTDYAWGRTVETDLGIQRDVDESGASRVAAPAPPRRAVGIAWEQVDGSEMYGTDPDYIMASETGNAEAVAMRRSTAVEMEAVARLAREGLMVYLPRIPKSTSSGDDTFNLVRRDEAILCSLPQGPRLENVLGDELADPGEVIRVQTMTFVEEV